MAVAVIDALEVVDIEHGKAKRLVLAAGAEAAIFEQLQDMRVVVQPGQAVAHHPRLQVTRTRGTVAHSGDQVAWFDRFGEEIVTALAHRIQLFIQVVLSRQVDDRHADVAVVVANHLGQFGAGTGRHIHVEDDQVGLEIRQLGHGLDRLDQGAGDNSGTVEQAFGVQRLGPRVVDDQHFVRFVLGRAGQHFDLFQQA